MLTIDSCVTYRPFFCYQVSVPGVYWSLCLLFFPDLFLVFPEITSSFLYITSTIKAMIPCASSFCFPIYHFLLSPSCFESGFAFPLPARISPVLPKTCFLEWLEINSYLKCERSDLRQPYVQNYPLVRFCPPSCRQHCCP